MASIADLYNLWLKPHHLPADKPVSVTIESAKVEELHPRPGQVEKKLILSFVGKSRQMIINDGNANRLADLGGEDYTQLAGLVILLKRQRFTQDKETVIILPVTNGKG